MVDLIPSVTCSFLLPAPIAKTVEKWFSPGKFTSKGIAEDDLKSLKQTWRFSGSIS